MPYVVTSSGTDGKRRVEADTLKEAVRLGDQAEAEGRSDVSIINLQDEKWSLSYAKMQLGSTDTRSM
jgi:hypothetical protein